MEQLKTLLIERSGAVLTITLNRPHKLNAMSDPVWLS